MCDRLPELEDVPVVFFDTDWDRCISSYPTTKPENLSTLNHLAYVLFTSGTTGLPKGVALPHRSTRALVGWVGSNFSLQELSGMLAAASIGFDMSVTEILGTLAWVDMWYLWKTYCR
jgi:non-ribosomal peptide synthetase component F